MTIVQAEWARALALLSGAEEVALACHVDPDGDALGSMLALALHLRHRGVRVAASFGTAEPAADEQNTLAVPRQYHFLPGVDLLVPPSAFPSAPAVMVVVDCATVARLGSLRPAAEAAETVLVIDHHASGEPFGDVRLVDGDAAATAVLVDEVIRRAGGALDADIATCLYVALVTDTDRFTESCVTPAVMELGARLLSYGVDQTAIAHRVYDEHSFGYVKLLGRAMERATLVRAVGLLWTAVTSNDLEQLGLVLTDTEGLIDVLRGVEHVPCTMVAKQKPSGNWAVSLRSRGDVDVGRIARALGGGGHRFAAGFSSRLPLQDVVRAVVEQLSGDRSRVLLAS